MLHTHVRAHAQFCPKIKTRPNLNFEWLEERMVEQGIKSGVLPFEFTPESLPAA